MNIPHTMSYHERSKWRDWIAQFHIIENCKPDRTLKLAGTKSWDLFIPWNSVWSWTIKKKLSFLSHLPFCCCHMWIFSDMKIKSQEGLLQRAGMKFPNFSNIFYRKFQVPPKKWAEKSSKYRKHQRGTEAFPNSAWEDFHLYSLRE